MRIPTDILVLHKTKLLIAIVSLASLGLILSIARVALPDAIPSRSLIMVIVFCVKSLLAITYEVVTEHLSSMRRFASAKANMILNILEPLFWFTAFVLNCMAASTRCVGSFCGLTIVLILLTLTAVFMTLCLAVISVHEWRYSKADRKYMGASEPTDSRYGSNV
ncbi:hypothetical protein BS50DRAFT_381392 [Corynespora cassiicola Philippines]|uniref:MARVEL domain-containing protein n=1 Tax=Corynespora cassiicola Philippines TaxID=1448308 RepID=A0A2T2NNR1_CORCC|nr:hypothetical protein BS50DRAFT_381392 [Corynespora cassiicola Philippines]